MSASDTLNIGLIGTGRIGRLHGAHLAHQAPGARLAVIADVNLERAAECAEDFGVGAAGGDWRAVVEHPEVDAVVICSPTDTHPEMITAAAKAGKHIFCEKPIGSNLEEIDAALAAVKQARVQLMMGFNRRFDANFARIRQAVVQGEVGEVHMLHIISRDPAPPPIDYVKVSGGLFMDMTIHDFDMVRFLTGSEVTEVYTAAAVRVDPAIGEAGDVDTAVITLKLANGVIATIDNSRKAVYGYDQRVEAFGSGGAIAVANNYPNTATLSTGESVHRDLPLNFFMDRYTQSYLDEMRAFVDGVREEKAMPVTGEDARAAYLIAKAAGLSHQEGRPVRVSEIS
jgi:myo-inositol 2-dehydrogenase / D-chiro-inositol 1-dehydrogenase